MVYKYLRIAIHKFIKDTLLDKEYLRYRIEIDETQINKLKRTKTLIVRKNVNRERKIILGLVQRERTIEGIKPVIIFPIKNKSQETILPAIDRNVRAGSAIFTDGHRTYSIIQSEISNLK